MNNDTLIIGSCYLVAEEVIIADDSFESKQTTVFPAKYLGNGSWQPVQFPAGLGEDGSLCFDDDMVTGKNDTVVSLENFRGEKSSAELKTKVIAYCKLPDLNEFHPF